MRIVESGSLGLSNHSCDRQRSGTKPSSVRAVPSASSPATALPGNPSGLYPRVWVPGYACTPATGVSSLPEDVSDDIATTFGEGRLRIDPPLRIRNT